MHHLSPGMVVTDLLTHDYTPEEFAKAKKIFNILADRVETVTPWLAERVLAGGSNGSRVAWLTRRQGGRPVRHRGLPQAGPLRRRRRPRDHRAES